MSYSLGRTSLRRLQGVHPTIVRVIKRAIQISAVDFTVVEGMRTKETQRIYVKRGVSKTMNSRHLTGHAVDLAPWIDGKIAWKDHGAFELIRDAMFQAADELGVLLQWGGDWDFDSDSADESFLDMPHWQVPWPYRMSAAKKAQERRIKARMVKGRQTEEPDLREEMEMLREMFEVIEERMAEIEEHFDD